MFWRAISLACLAGLAAGPLRAESIETMLAEGKLKQAYNPVLLDYLLEEGKKALPEKQRKRAIDQVVTALKQAIEITPEEQRAAALAAAAAGLAELLGGQTVAELGQAGSDATHAIWREWVEAAFTLRKAGYEKDADAFFEKCVEIYPYADLRARCAVGLALSRPAEAFERVFALTEQSDPNAVKPALRILGDMAQQDELPEASRAAAIERITEFTKGLKKATYGEAACDALVRTRDERVVKTLRDLSQGIMNQDISPCALRGLLLTFDDRSVVPELEKKLGGGLLDTTKPHEKLAAATLLIEAGEPAGYEWAAYQLTGEKKADKREKAMKKGKEKGRKDLKEGDFRPALVRSLARTGGDEAVKVLRQGFATAKRGSWIETWIAIGLLELRDSEHLDLVEAALGSMEWDFTVVRAAQALAKRGDHSGIAALAKLDEAALSRRPKNKDDAARLVRLRQDIASALGDMDRPQAAELLARMLDDPEPAVRAGAAYALARMGDASALPGLRKAMGVDYGRSAKQARTPVVQAHVMRSTARRFDGAKLKPLVDAALKSPEASVRFLALSLTEGSA